MIYAARVAMLEMTFMDQLHCQDKCYSEDVRLKTELIIIPQISERYNFRKVKQKNDKFFFKFRH